MNNSSREQISSAAHAPAVSIDAANVSDTTFAREVWRHNERGNIDAAKEVRELWKYSKGSDGYGAPTGALTTHEIRTFAEKHLQGANGDATGFARAIERAVLIKAYTLLPELRQAEAAKHHRRFFRDGLNYGLAIYCGAIRALAMGRIPGEVDPEQAKLTEPRRASEIAKIEVKVDAEAVRPGFEAWAGQRQFDLRREDGGYANMVTAYAWMGWLGATSFADGKTHIGTKETSDEQ